MQFICFMFIKPHDATIQLVECKLWEEIRRGLKFSVRIMGIKEDWQLCSKQIRLLSCADKELTNSQEKELSNSLYWLIKTSRQVVIFIYRQRTNKQIRLSSLLVAQIGLTDTHTDISHWTQFCHSYIIPMVLMWLPRFLVVNVSSDFHNLYLRI